MPYQFKEERAVQLAVIFRLIVRDTEPQRDRIGRGPGLPVRMPCCLVSAFKQLRTALTRSATARMPANFPSNRHVDHCGAVPLQLSACFDARG